jgi:hypothetical protein
MQIDTFHSFRFDFEEVQPRFEEIQSFLDPENSDDSHPVNAAIKEIIPLLADNDGITGGYILRKADKLHLNTGAQIGRYLKGAEYLALFVCTAGAIFTELTGRFNAEGNYLEAFVVDHIGSLTVEKAMDKIQAYLAIEMQTEGLQISNRYSPGYCDWPVSNQRELFDRMGELPFAVSLTESCLMLPIKSVSGIIGIGTHIRKRPYACQICKKKDCTYRRLIQ